MIIPKYINENEEIYLVAPSFGCTFEPYISRLNQAIKYIESRNYLITEGPNVRESDIASSNTKFKRAEEINAAFKNNSRILWSVGGGEIMVDILEYLNKEDIKSNPKWFIGYSDNTNLTYLLPTLYCISSIYGINFPTIGLDNPASDVLDTLELIKGNKKTFTTYTHFELKGIESTNPLQEVNLDTKVEIKAFVNKEFTNDSQQFSGILLGGCLDVLVNILGTEFDKTTDFIQNNMNKEIIFFFEACDLTPTQIYTKLLQLKRAGWFKNTKNILFGMPLSAYNKEFAGMNHINACTLAFEDTEINMYLDLPIGHFKPTLPMVTGATVEIEFKNNQITFNYSI